MTPDTVDRLLICGSRYWRDHLPIRHWLNMLMPNIVIAGGARGADTVASLEADRLAIPTLIYPADWNRHGRRAGYIRNKQMLDEGRPTFVLAFKMTEHENRGTTHMVDLAEKAGVPWKIVWDR